MDNASQSRQGRKQKTTAVLCAASLVPAVASTYLGHHPGPIRHALLRRTAAPDCHHARPQGHGPVPIVQVVIRAGEQLHRVEVVELGRRGARAVRLG